MSQNQDQHMECVCPDFHIDLSYEWKFTLIIYVYA